VQLNQVNVKTAATKLPTRDEAMTLERRMNLSLPAGYIEFITTLGAGYFGSCLRVYAPKQIERDILEWRERIDKYWFWDQGCQILTKQKSLESVVFADTVGGDEFIFHPKISGKIFVLPRESEAIFEAGDSLWSMIDWLETSGILYPPFVDLTFEAFPGDV
jgi:hypothetical protein